MPVQKWSGGLKALPVHEAEMEWPDGQCFPRLVSHTQRPRRPTPPVPSIELIAGTWLGVCAQFLPNGTDYPRVPCVVRLILHKDGTGRMIIADPGIGRTGVKEITRTEISGHKVVFRGAQLSGLISIWGELQIDGSPGTVQLMREDQLLKGISGTSAIKGDAARKQ